MFLVNLFS